MSECCHYCVGYTPDKDSEDFGLCDPGGNWPDHEPVAGSWSCELFVEEEGDL